MNTFNILYLHLIIYVFVLPDFVVELTVKTVPRPPLAAYQTYGESVSFHQYNSALHISPSIQHSFSYPFVVVVVLLCISPFRAPV